MRILLSRRPAPNGDALCIDHYKYDVYMFTHQSPCIWQANLKVKDGVVTAAGRRSDWPDDLSTLDVPVFPFYEPKADTPFLCNYHNYTMLKLFDQFEEWLQISTSSLYFVNLGCFYSIHLISCIRQISPSSRPRKAAWVRSLAPIFCKTFVT